MHQEITIRSATLDDAAAIVAFQEAMAWETEALRLDHDTVTRGVAAVFEQPARGVYWIAERATQSGDPTHKVPFNHEIVGALLTTSEWSDWRNGEILWLQSVYVIPAARRRGVFRQLMEHVRRHIIQAGHRGLRLYVEKQNTAAQHTYRSLGMHNDHYDMYEWMR
jgi:ribosomal protein S18 acetylase RimI-like enzyme